MQKKNICKTLLLLVTLGVMLSEKASATHIKGSDISFKCLGGNQYQVVVTIYRDCSGIGAPTSISVDVTSTCGSSLLTCDEDTGNSGIEVSQLCPTAVSTCNGGTLAGVELYTYIGNLTLQPNCGVYTFSYSECCRNASNNLLDAAPPSLGFSVQATLNSDLTNCDNAPAFSSLPIPAFFAGKPANYSNGAIDAEGDSLVYALITPLDDVGAALTYQGTFTAANPLPTTGGFNFDQQTGQMSFLPSAQGIYVIDIKVSEYRNGVLIGTTMRDLQFNIGAGSNNPPRVNNCITASNSSGGYILNCSAMGVCPGQAISFTIGAKDPDGEAITVFSNISSSIPGAILTTANVGGPDSVQVTFSWTPLGTDTGYRYFTIGIQDNACPVPGLQFFTYAMDVASGTVAGPDKYYCAGGNPVTVQMIGGTHFSWTPTTGIASASADSSLLTFEPAVNTTYYVHSDLSGGCHANDTITIFHVNSFSTNVATPDDSVCLNSTVSITVTPAPSSEGPFTYTWGPANSGIQNATLQTVNALPTASTLYQVTVTSNSGCVMTAAQQIVVEGRGPDVVIQPSANNVCPGSTVSLNTSVTAVICGPVADPQNPCAGGSSFVTYDSGSDTASAGVNTTPYTGFYMDGRVQYLYRASELQAMGLTAGTITKIGFNVAIKSSTQPYNSFSVKMGCTALDQLSVNYVSSGLSTVLFPQNYTTVTGWNIDSLDVPYDWDGLSNLIIEVCFDNSSYTQYDAVRYTPTSYTNSVLWKSVDLPTSSGCTSIPAGTLGQNRPNTRFVMCEAPPVPHTITWTGSDGSVLPQVSNPAVTVDHDVTYTAHVVSGNCQTDASVNLFVDTAVAISAGNDTSICLQAAQLHAALLHPSSQTCVADYRLDTINYTAIVPVGGTTSAVAGDDVVSAGIPIPFAFNFFCNPVAQLYVSTNGFLSFSAGQGAGCCAGQNIPNATTPNNVIALCWADLNSAFGGTIDHFTSGTSPNRVKVIRWNNVSIYGGGGAVTGEIHLYETTGIVEIHVSSQNTGEPLVTLGLENSTGTGAVHPAGYNASGWAVSTPVAFRFTPRFSGDMLTGIHWSPSLGLSNDTILNPTALPSTSTNYVVTANFASGCITRDTVNVSVGASLHSVADTICSGTSYSFNGQNLTAAGNYLDTVVIPGGCDSIVSLHLSVNQSPAVVLSGNPDTACINAGTVALSGGSPTGGIYSGTGVNGAAFAPAVAGTGSHSITYSYTDNHGCSNAATENIVVDSCISHTCNALYILYPDTALAHHWYAVNQATGSAPLTYLWSWGDGNTSTGATPSHIYANPAYYNICLSITDATGCTDTYCDSSTNLYKTEQTLVTVNCVLQLPNAVEEVDAAAFVRIHPNPTDSRLFIETNGLVADEINIYNATGSLVVQSKITQLGVDVSQLSPGVYIAEIRTKEMSIKKRWVKM